MLRSMQNEAGRQLVRKLTEDSAEQTPTDGELVEARERANMLHAAAGPVGATAGAVAATFALVKALGGRLVLGGALGALASPLAVAAGVGVGLWGLHRWFEGS